MSAINNKSSLVTIYIDVFIYHLMMLQGIYCREINLKPTCARERRLRHRGGYGHSKWILCERTSLSYLLACHRIAYVCPHINTYMIGESQTSEILTVMTIYPPNAMQRNVTPRMKISVKSSLKRLV